MLRFLPIRNRLLKHPRLVAAIKRVYKSRAVHNWGPFQLWVMRRCATVDARIGAVPSSVALETTVFCNAKCRMCGHGWRKMTGTMEMGLFSNLIDEIAAMGLRHVTLSVYGEPFADKFWIERIRKVRDANLTYDFFSNASLLKRDTLEEMLALGGWKGVNFSVNGFSPEVYEELMSPLKRNTVYSKIAMLLELKQSHGPHVTISLVQTKQNAHEIGDFLKFWKTKSGVDRLILADCGDWLGTVTEKIIPAKGRSKHLSENAWLGPCASLWSGLFVYHDGRVTPCCEDAVDRSLICGNTRKQTLGEVFSGSALAALRKLHRHNQRKRHPICGKCRVSPSWI